MEPPSTSIVILCRNELEYTQRCVASIVRCTPEPHDLVFVDNGSTDGTLEWLRGLAGATVVDNEHNLGFGGGCNQGIAAARGERVLLLNNDVVVTAGWLGALHRELDADARVGITGPRSNYVAGPQVVPSVGYDASSLDGLDEWAVQWSRAHAGTSDPFVRLVGFCLLVRREVIDAIGGFDLRFGLGNFEDDDFCLRAAVAGFGARIVHNSYIHHYGSRTFAGERIDYAATMAVNLERFAAKWRMGEGDMDGRTGAYDAQRLVDRMPKDPARLYAPLVGVVDDGASVELTGARSTVLALPCDRLDPIATRDALRAALRAVGPDDDITLAIRVDPRDAEAHVLLDAVAEEVGDAQLPDVVLLEARDENDAALLRAVDAVLVFGPCAAARAAHARHLGVTVTTHEELPRLVAGSSSEAASA